MNEDVFTKCRNYSIEKLTFSTFSIIYQGIIELAKLYQRSMLNTWCTSTQMALKLNQRGILVISSFFIVIEICSSKLFYMPLGLYRDFVLEEKYGFNRQTLSLHMLDLLRITILQILVEVPMSAAAVYIINQGGQFIHIWLWFIQLLFVIILMRILPTFILPMFNEFQPMPDGSLKDSIANLAQTVGFPLSEIFIMDGSRRSSRANAFFIGSFGTKRIVLFDNLLAKENDKAVLEDDEILAVLCHKFGHWKHRHVMKGFTYQQITILLILTLVCSTISYTPMYKAFGFPPHLQSAIVGFFIIRGYILIPFYFLENLISKYFERAMELQADSFAIDMNYGQALRSGLLKFMKNHFTFPLDDPLYSMWNFTHPSLLERIRYIDSIQKLKKE